MSAPPLIGDRVRLITESTFPNNGIDIPVGAEGTVTQIEGGNGQVIDVNFDLPFGSGGHDWLIPRGWLEVVS